MLFLHEVKRDSISGGKWIFGDNVEDAMGRAGFAIFYLLCGLAAAGAQLVADSLSPIPMVGASGAIGGVTGAYIVLYPRVHVHLLVFLGFYVTTLTRLAKLYRAIARGIL